MAPDKLQQAWQSGTANKRVTVDEDVLLEQVVSKQRGLVAKTLGFDVLEIVVGILLTGFCIYLGVLQAMPWTWYLTIPATIWVCGFLLQYRRSHCHKPSEPGDGLFVCVSQSLRQLDSRIWLVRNLAWWALLPCAIAVLAFLGQTSWQKSDNWQEFAVEMFGWISFVGVLYGGLFFMNQRVVSTKLEPQRQEYLGLLAGLSDETNELLSTSGWLAGEELVDGQQWGRRLLFVLAGLSIGGLLTAAVVYFEGGFPGLGGGPGLSGLNPLVAAADFNGEVRKSGEQGDALAKLVMEQRSEKDLVALAAMVMVDGKVVGAAAHGERKIRSGISVEIDDKWHLGGITKTVTATMIARLIEDGKVKWTTSVGEVFPDAELHDAWKAVTVRQLLTDTAGAPPHFSLEVRSKQPRLGPACTEIRRDVVLGVMAKKPDYPPGSKSVYSSVGYTIAGAMAEEVTGKRWEELVEELVHQPLKLKHAGAGPPLSDRDNPEQPRGHRIFNGTKRWLNDRFDNTMIMAPAACSHMSLLDLCTFANDHLKGYFREGELLSTETYRMLHTPEFDQRACGWVRTKPNATIPVTTYWNNGTNTAWYACVVFVPEKNMVVAVASNDGDLEKAEAAAIEILKVQLTPVKAEAED